VAARGCNAAGSWRCGCARPGSRHAGWARADGGELPTRWLLVEWPLGKATPTKYWLANLPETTPLVELVGLASVWPGRAGEWSRTTASSRAPSGWTTSGGVAGQAGTTTSRWSQSRTAFSPWNDCAAQNRRRRPDPVAIAGRAAGPARLLGRRLSGVPASRPRLATPNGTTTRPDLTARLVVRLPTQAGGTQGLRGGAGSGSVRQVFRQA
jgi:hypothetical protein